VSSRDSSSTSATPVSARARSHRNGFAATAAALRLGLLGGAATAVLGGSSLASAVTSQPATVDVPGAAVASPMRPPVATTRAVTAQFKAATEASATHTPPAYFSDPVYMPHSDNIGEPSLIADYSGALYVAGPGSLGSGQQTVFLWKSTDGGTSFTGPIHTNTLAGEADSPIGGGDADIAVDRANDIYLADLWLGNSTMEVSSDGGASWTANPWGHLQPGDDRPWLTYDGKTDSLYAIWDGVDGIHVGKALLRSAVADARASVLFVQDVIAIPEQAAPPVGALQQTSIRNCVCPTGNIVVDRAGTLWFAFSRQSGPNLGGGIGIASSTDGGVTWTQTSIDGSGNGSSPTSVGLNFPLMRADDQGNLYVTWAEPVNLTPSVQVPEVFYSWKGASDTKWHAPLMLTASLAGAMMPTLAVVSPGIVDIAYYQGNPTGGGFAVWDLDITQLVGANTGSPILFPQVAYPAVYSGQALPRFPGFGDFFSIIVDPTGMAGIVSDVGVGQNLFKLMFIHQTAPLNAAVTFKVDGAQCPAGLNGTPPNCTYVPKCPAGMLGTYPDCSVPGAAGAASPSPSADAQGPNGSGAGNTDGHGPDALTVSQRAALSHVMPKPQSSAASGGLSLLVGGAIVILFCGVAMMARART
jgi:hypothetical protein